MLDSDPAESLRRGFASANRFDGWFTILVVIGVAIELITLIRFSKGMDRWERIGLIFGSLLVVGGVAGEYHFGKAANEAAAQLQQMSDQRVAESARRVAALQVVQESDHRIAMQAAAHAADLGVTLGNLQRFVRIREALASGSMTALATTVANDQRALARAVERVNIDRARLSKVQNAADASVRLANQDLTQMRSDQAQVQADLTQARTDFEQMNTLLQQERALDQQMVLALTARLMSPSQQIVTAQKLSRFAPMTADIIVLGDTLEMLGLGRSLQQMLATAGWTVNLFTVIGNPPNPGVGIGPRNDAPPRARIAADALVRVLLSDRIDSAPLTSAPAHVYGVVSTLTGSTSSSPGTADISILIGQKP
jgi:hypothetical protein